MGAERKENANENAAPRSKKDLVRAALRMAETPMVPTTEDLSESGSVASSTLTTNTLDSMQSSKSGKSAMSEAKGHNARQSQIFARHTSMQRKQHIHKQRANKNGGTDKE